MQTKQLYFQILSFLFLVFLSGVSQANVATLSSNIANGSPFNTIDSGFTGQFDLNPYLTPHTDFIVPYQINSAHFNLTFSGADFFSSITSFSRGYEFVCRGCIDGPDNSLWINDVFIEKYSPFESAAIYLGGVRVAFGQTKPFGTDYTVTGVTSDGFENIGGNGTYYQTRTHTRSYGYDGNFSLSGDVTDFSSLSNTGLLPFNLVFSGGVNLLSSTLTVDYSVNPVPEPESYAMLLVGLGFLGFISRKKST